MTEERLKEIEAALAGGDPGWVLENACEWVPELVAEVRRLRAEVEGLREDPRIKYKPDDFPNA